MRVPCAIRIFSESCPAAVSTFCRLDRLSVVLGKTLFNCEIWLMNKVAILAFILLAPFGVDGGELRNTYYWYCPRCNYRDSAHQSMDEIIENRPPAKPSYDSRNCREAHGSTYCYWALHKGTADVDLDEITNYRERKRMKRINEEFNKTNNKSSYEIIQEARGREGIELEKSSNAEWDKVKNFKTDIFSPTSSTNEATEKVKNFNTDLVAPAAPFEVLKK